MPAGQPPAGRGVTKTRPDRLNGMDAARETGSTMTGGPLTDGEIDQFIEQGFVHLPAVVPAEVVAAGQSVIWSDLGRSPDDPTSWKEPVERLLPSDPEPFGRAFAAPGLTGAFDQLVGPGRWQPRRHLGIFVVRFPHRAPPADTGWHVDESTPAEGYASVPYDFSQWRVNILARQRALLALFFYSDIGPEDGPTLLRVGSHLDVPPLLHAAGATGMSFARATALAAQASTDRSVALATGAAGDVYLCHPFLVHGAQAVQGRRPRLMSQTPLISDNAVELDKPAETDSPLETAIRRGLA
jgi:hypothetical protein